MSLRDDIARLLEAHVPADDREASFVDAMRSLVGTAGDPTSRDHFDPGHFTASAFVLSPDRRDVLLIEHSKLHRWLQPGGHIEPADATLHAAARREVAEETSIVELDPWTPGLLDVDIHDIPSLKGQPPHQHFDLRCCFVARVRSFSAGSDAKAAAWVSRADIDPSITDESVMRALRKLAASLD